MKLEDVYFWIFKTNNVTNIVRNCDKTQLPTDVEPTADRFFCFILSVK